jgi:hypothetical protein
MFETVVRTFVYTLMAYATAGVLFAVPFVTLGITRVDEEARGSGLGFRLLIIPGVAALWPLLLYRCAAGITEPPVERNPHR